MPIPTHYDDLPSGDGPLEATNPLGWAFWTGLGAIGINRGLKRKSPWALLLARGAAKGLAAARATPKAFGGQLASAVRGDWASVARPIQQTIANAPQDFRDYLHRPIALHKSLQDLLGLEKSGGLRGLSRKDIAASFSEYGGAAAEGSITLRDVLAGISGARGNLARELVEMRKTTLGLKRQLGPRATFKGLLDLPLEGIVRRGGKIADVRKKRYLIPQVLDKDSVGALLGGTVGMIAGGATAGPLGILGGGVIGSAIGEALLGSAKGALKKGISLPIIGKVEGMERPFRWLADMLAPTGMIREQTHFETFINPVGTRFLKRSVRDPKGDLSNIVQGFYYKRINKKLVGRKVVRTNKFVGSEQGIYPTNATGYLSKKVSARGVRLAYSDTGVGKGIQLRSGLYTQRAQSVLKGKTRLEQYASDMNISKDSWLHKVLKFGDRFGVGPQFAAPKVETRPYGQKLRKGRIGPASAQQDYTVRKHGVFDWLYSKAYKAAYGREPYRVLRKKRPGPVDRQSVWMPEYTSLVPNKPGSSIRGRVVSTANRLIDKPGGIIQGLSDFTNHLFMRPMALLEGMTGIGIEPGTNPIQTIWKLLTRVALPFWAGFQGLRYADYKVKELFGYSPAEAALDAYIGAQLSIAGVRDVSGLTRVSQRLEEALPGVIGSPLSFFGRAAGGALLGAKLGGKLPFFGKGILPVVGAGLGGMLFGGDPTKTTTDLSRMYSGQEPVGVRRSRWWEMGRDSFFGRDIQYYRPHAIALFKSKYQQKSLYGSEQAYWQHGTYFPTPENLFGIKKLLNPYYAAERNMESRPYPMYAGVGGDIPIVGPAIEGLFHQVFGIKTHPMLEQSLRGQMATGPSIPGMAKPTAPVSRFDLSQIAGKQASALQDWFGLPGFMFGALKAGLVGGGTDLFTGGAQLETSDRMDSTERWFYETLNIGGGLTSSELLRRFIPHRRRQIELINPIPNIMPGWLPGSRSLFAGDRDSPKDFHTGDPYTKIPTGEGRLPGVGYEALRPLHSGIPGVYDPVDRLLILADIAPYSEAYKHHKTIVDMWMKAGIISSEWSREVVSAKQRITDRSRSRQFGTPNLMEAPDAITMTGTLTRVTGPGTFAIKEMPGQQFKLAGIHSSQESAIHNMLANQNASTVEQARFKVESLTQSLKERMNSMVGQTIQLQIAKDEAARYEGQQITAIVPGVSQEYFDTALGDRGELGMAAYLRGGTLTRGIGNAWYGVTSKSLPPPFGWIKNKLLPNRSPLDDYYEFQARGPRVGLWEKPWEGYVKPWLRSWTDWVTPGDNIPGEFRNRQLLEQRFGALSYIKAKMNAAQAQGMGNAQLAKKFESQASGTPAGLDASDPRQMMLYGRQAVPTWERAYLDNFKGLKSTQERERALGMVSPSMGYVLANYWKSEMPSGQFSSPGMQGYAEMYSPEVFRGNVLNDLMTRVELPAGDWAGWDPQFDMKSAKVRYIERIGEDIHNYGLWESDSRMANRQFPNLPVPEMLALGDPSAAIFHNNLAAIGLSSQVLGYGFGYGGGSGLNISFMHNGFQDKLRGLLSRNYRLQSSIYNYQ